MKTSIKLFALGMILTGFSVSVNAQVTASASASATIVTPIAINHNSDMGFGTVAVLNSTGGTVVLSPDGSRTRTNGVTLPKFDEGKVSAASFVVTGEKNYTYSISLPGKIELSDGTHYMMVDKFNHNFGTELGSLIDGKSLLSVGATLNVEAAQPAGTYKGEFSVMVNYN